MFKEEKIVVILLLMAVGSIGVIHWTLSVPPMPFSEDLPEGTKVTLIGEVVGVRPTWKGEHAILHIKCDEGLVKVFVPEGKERIGDFEAGSEVSVVGEIEVYEGEIEVVADPGDIELYR